MGIDSIAEWVRSRDRERYALFAQQGNEPSLEELVSFEDTIGFSLPDDFRKFVLHPLGGLYVEANEKLWPRAKEFDVGPFWSFLRGFWVYSLSSAAPTWFQIARAWEEMAESGNSAFVPFLKVIGDADRYCFMRGGEVVIWRHEEPDNPSLVEMTFGQVVMHEIAELENRMARIIGNSE